MVKTFRIIGLCEGISFLLLLGIAMPLKYMAGIPEAVKFIGWAHGLLFMIYFMAATVVPLQGGVVWRLGAMAAGVVPFGPFIFDRWVDKRAGWGRELGT